jgi:hypothetical protein
MKRVSKTDLFVTPYVEKHKHIPISLTLQYLCYARPGWVVALSSRAEVETDRLIHPSFLRVYVCMYVTNKLKREG